MQYLLDLDPPSMWNAGVGTGDLTLKVALSLIAGFALLAACLAMPAQLRKPVVAFFTFISGLFYVALYLFPAPIHRNPTTDAPKNIIDATGFWLSDAVPVVANISNIIAGFLIGLGVYSLLRVHFGRIARKQTDWIFSAVLLLSMLLMTVFGYMNYINKNELQENWTIWNRGTDFLFDGMLQQMDAAMFSIIAFYILSAAYRAFRIRSTEATILLSAALIVMLSLMSAVEYLWGTGISNLAHNDPHSFIQNFSLTEISGWIRNQIQVPSIRGMDFGVGVGLLAMGLRIWLNLEKTGE